MLPKYHSAKINDNNFSIGVLPAPGFPSTIHASTLYIPPWMLHKKISSISEGITEHLKVSFLDRHFDYSIFYLNIGTEAKCEMNQND